MRRHDRRGQAKSRGNIVAVLLSAGLVTAAFGGLAGTQTAWVQEEELTASDGDKYADFGTAVSLDGDTALVGSPGVRNDTTGSRGAAYVYAHDGNGDWTEEAKLIAANEEPGDFSRDVSLDGDTAIVGAQFDDNANGDDAGAAYVFTRDDNGDWTEQAKLLASDGEKWDAFGSSVSLEGDTAFVGAVGDDNANGDGVGAVYVFVRDGNGGWTEQAKFIPSDGGGSGSIDIFAESVSLEGDTAIVGDRGDDNINGEDGGAAYLYIRNETGAWGKQAKLLGADGEDGFGLSVDLGNDTAIIGAYTDDNDNGEDAGAAYVYTRDGNGAWSKQSKLTASDGDKEDFFGWSVSLEGDTAIVGARSDENVDENGDGNGLGAAYVYTRDGNGEWTEQAKLTADDDAGDDYDELGASVTLENATALVGAPNADNANGDDAGAAYFFSNTTTGNIVHDFAQNDAGTGEDASDDPDEPTMLPGGSLIHVNGTLVLGSDDVDAYGTAVENDTTRAMLFNFTAPVGMPLNLTLVAPNGTVVDNDSTTVAGGTALVEAPAEPDGFLQAGVWVTVLEIEAVPGQAPAAGSSSGLLPIGAGASDGSGFGVGESPTAKPAGTSAAGPEFSFADDGLVPSVVPDRFTVVDYRDERPCDPKC